MTASGSRLTDVCAATSASSCRSKEESARASMLCARASAGFSSMAWRSERMPPCRSPVCIWTTPMDTWASAREGSSSRARRAAAVASRRGLGRRRHPSRRANDVAIGERRPRRGELRIDVERPLHVTEAEFDPFGRSAPR